MNYTNRQKRELVKNDYDAIAKTFDENYHDTDYLKPILDDFMKGLKGDKILEVGSAGGNVCNFFYCHGFVVTGIDFSGKLIKLAKEKYPSINFVQEDIVDYQTDEKFDGIFSCNTLFHLPDEDISSVLQNFKKMLNENGALMIVLELPNDEAGEKIYTEELDSSQKIYYNYLSPEKMKQFLTSAGFKIEKFEISKDNKYASVYAHGFMIIKAVK